MGDLHKLFPWEARIVVRDDIKKFLVYLKAGRGWRIILLCYEKTLSQFTFVEEEAGQKKGQYLRGAGFSRQAMMQYLLRFYRE